MPDIYDKDKPHAQNWTGPVEARRFTVWLILWVMIDLAIITWIFASGNGAEGASSIGLLTTRGIISLPLQ